MKKIALFFSIVIVVCLLGSCGNESKTSNQSALILQPNDSLFRVNEGGYDFNIILPKDMMIENEPSITVNSATGELNIQVGNQFWIVASLEKNDIQSIKADLKEDMLFTSRVMEEDSKSIMYQRLLPDGTAYDYSFKSTNDVGGKSYFFRTCEEGDFNMENVGRMKAAISSIHSAV